MSDFAKDIQRLLTLQSEKPLVVRLAHLSLFPGFYVLIPYRFGRWIRTLPRPLTLILWPLYALLFLLNQIVWGAEISSSARIGPGLLIFHTPGIVIGGKSVIGKNATLHQEVTIGYSKGECPTIGDNIIIYPGAKIFGKITVGNNVIISSNTAVFKDVPDNAVIAPAPFITIREGTKA